MSDLMSPDGVVEATHLDAIGIDDPADVETRDRGAILVMVLVLGVIGSLFVLPMLYYVSTVSRASSVPTDKAGAVEMAEGGTWVALNNQGDLFDLCVGGELPSSLTGVTTTCEVIAREAMRDASAVPYHAAAVEAGAQVPAEFSSTLPYINPNTASDPSAWLATPDWASEPVAGTVWLPQLPVRSTSGGTGRDTTMKAGAQDPRYTSCRVFFPGTFTDPIEIDEPTYFTSGVYYFTQPIVIRSGADIVVGNGSALGCTSDPEAIAAATAVPSPLNMSGAGATFVLGGDARIEIDDDGTADIRFAMNQRYVSELETSVAASESVSIVSVNGDHTPFVGAGALGDPLVVPGVTSVPASTVGADGNPRAADVGYLPSTLTAKPSAPDAPTITAAVSYQRDRSGNNGPNDRGRVTVMWDAPSPNGAAITGYTVTDSTTGRTCSPTTSPGHAIQTSCTIDGIRNQNGSTRPVLTVTATNLAGTSAPSSSFTGTRVDLNGGTQSPGATPPAAPADVVVTNHVDGLNVSWTPSASDGGSPITGYRVMVTDTITAQVAQCDAWWNETSCNVTPASGALAPGVFDVAVVALQTEGTAPTQFASAPSIVAAHAFTPNGDPAVDLTPVAPVIERTAILDFTVASNARVDVSIEGYVAVPQGRIALGSTSPATSSVAMTGGVVAGDFALDPTGVPDLDIRFDNPVAQKRVRLVSVATSNQYTATSTAIVQVNKSGSIAINSWMVQ